MQQLIAEGDSITYVAGRATITLQRTVQTWTVTVYIGNLRVEDNCGTYATEAEARAVARGYAVMYRDEAKPATLASVAPVGEPLRFAQLAGGATTRTSDPMDLILVAAHRCGGTISRGAQATSLQILALEKRGYLNPVRIREGRTWRIVAGNLTPAGVRVATRLLAVAA